MKRIFALMLCLVVMISLIVIYSRDCLRKASDDAKADVSSESQGVSWRSPVPSTDNCLLTDQINKIYRMHEFADFDETKLSATISLTYQPSGVYLSSGENVHFIDYAGEIYTNHGLMSEENTLGEFIGKAACTEQIEMSNIEESTAKTGIDVYEITGVNSDCAVAVKLVEENGCYLYVNDTYFWTVGTLTEYLDEIGFDENSIVYVEMVTSCRAFRIFCTEISFNYVTENILSKAKEAYDGESTEGQALTEGVDVTGLAIRISSNQTGGGFWVYFLENGNLILGNGLNMFNGVPSFTIVLDMEDENFSVGTELINYMVENCELMILYEED